MIVLLIDILKFQHLQNSLTMFMASDVITIAIFEWPIL